MILTTILVDLRFKTHSTRFARSFWFRSKSQFLHPLASMVATFSLVQMSRRTPAPCSAVAVQRTAVPRSGVSRIFQRRGPKFLGPQASPITNWKLIWFHPHFRKGPNWPTQNKYRSAETSGLAGYMPARSERGPFSSDGSSSGLKGPKSGIRGQAKPQRTHVMPKRAQLGPEGAIPGLTGPFQTWESPSLTWDGPIRVWEVLQGLWAFLTPAKSHFVIRVRQTEGLYWWGPTNWLFRYSGYRGPYPPNKTDAILRVSPTERKGSETDVGPIYRLFIQATEGPKHRLRHRRLLRSPKVRSRLDPRGSKDP